MAGEDVEDELGAVEDAARKRGLKVAQLRGRQVVIEEDQVGIGGCGDAGDLLHLACADQRGWIRPGATLHEFGSDFAAGTAHQFAKLGERFIGIEARPFGGQRRRTLRIR